MTVPTCKKDNGFSLENHREISFLNNASKLLMAIIFRQLSSTGEMCVRGNQPGFRRGRKCIDQIFTLQQVAEHRPVFRKPTICLSSLEGSIPLSRWCSCLALFLVEGCAIEIHIPSVLPHLNNRSRVCFS